MTVVCNGVELFWDSSAVIGQSELQSIWVSTNDTQSTAQWVFFISSGWGMPGRNTSYVLSLTANFEWNCSFFFVFFCQNLKTSLKPPEMYTCAFSSSFIMFLSRVQTDIVAVVSSADALLQSPSSSSPFSQSAHPFLTHEPSSSSSSTGAVQSTFSERSTSFHKWHFFGNKDRCSSRLKCSISKLGYSEWQWLVISLFSHFIREKFALCFHYFNKGTPSAYIHKQSPLVVGF